jgi:hypothetical protein
VDISCLANLVGRACRAHKEVLFFASPFFEAALSGSWAETGRPPSMSSVITISQPPSIPGDKGINDMPEMTFAPVEPEPEDVELAFDSDNVDKSEGSCTTTSESEGSDAELVNRDDAAKDVLNSEEKDRARASSLAQLQRGNRASSRKRECKRQKTKRYVETSEEDELSPRKVYQPAQATVRRRAKANGPAADAVIVLKEERVCSVGCISDL